MSLIIALVLLALVFVYFVSIYNRLVTLKNNRENAFGDIDVQLKQRFDLIPQLLESVKGYMAHEAKVLTDITEARSLGVNARNIDEKIAADNKLSTALAGLNIAVEAYPNLKANENFLQLQTEISDIENKLAAARRFFNSATAELNTAIEAFPSNIVASVAHYQKAPLFDLGADRQKLEQAPSIKF